MCLEVDLQKTREYRRKKEVVAYKVVSFDTVDKYLKAPSRSTPYNISRPIKAKSNEVVKLYHGKNLYSQCVHAYLDKEDAKERWSVNTSDRLVVEIKTTGKNVVAVGLRGDIGFKQLTLTKSAVKKAIVEKLALGNNSLFNFYMTI